MKIMVDIGISILFSIFSILLISSMIIGAYFFVSSLRNATSAITLISVDRELLCRGLISYIMNHPIENIRVSPVSEGDVSVSYVRDDFTRWEYDCRFDENSIVWRSNLSSNYPGRWQDHSLDPMYTFEKNRFGFSVIESFPDGENFRFQLQRLEQ